MSTIPKQKREEPDFTFVIDAIKDLINKCECWKKRCEAAEKVIDSYNSDDSVYKYDELVKEWEQLKSGINKENIKVYTRNDCPFVYCDSPDGECEKQNRCHHA